MDYKTYSGRFNQRFYTAIAVCGDSYARLVAFNPKVVVNVRESLVREVFMERKGERQINKNINIT